MSYVIVSHVHDVARGVYEIVIGQQVVVVEEVETLIAAEDGEDPVLTSIPTEVTKIVAEESIVFADDDPQWHRDDERIPDDEAIELQCAAVTAALEARVAEQAKKKKAARVRPLDSVGRVLVGPPTP